VSAPEHVVATQQRPSRASNGLNSNQRLANPNRTMARPEARIRLRDPASLDGYIDGAWWPRSRDLSAELVPLLSTLTIAGHPIARVVYDLAFWSVTDRRARVGNRIVRLGGFAMPEANVVSFIDDTGVRRRLDVVVVEPEAQPDFAERVLALASMPGNRLRAAAILSTSKVTAPSSSS
jgi:hypothetical protein